MAQLDQVDVRTAPTNLQRENVMQQIIDISDVGTPFLSLIGRESHDNPFSEWLNDRLADPDTTNAIADGETAPAPANKRAVRLGNHAQISQKTVGTSTRFESSNLAGSQKLAKQISDATMELWRDMDAIATLNQANVVDLGAGSTAGLTAGLEAWVDDETIEETTGNTKSPQCFDDLTTGGIGIGGWTNRTGLLIPAVDYTSVTALGALSFAGVMDVLDAVYQLGSSPTKLFSRVTPMRRLSAYMFTSSAQIAALIRNADEIAAAEAINAVNKIVTDNGVIVDMVSSRLMAQTDSSAGTPPVSDTMFAFDPSKLAISFQGGGIRAKNLPVSGLGEATMIHADWMLKVMAPDALGAIFGINEASAAGA